MYLGQKTMVILLETYNKLYESMSNSADKQKIGKLIANLEKEIDCPNALTGVQCRDCRLCNGLGAHGNGKSITVIVHGTQGKINKFNAINL